MVSTESGRGVAATRLVFASGDHAGSVSRSISSGAGAWFVRKAMKSLSGSRAPTLMCAFVVDDRTVLIAVVAVPAGPTRITRVVW